MQSDYIQRNISQSVKSEFSADGRIISLLNFLENFLPIFPEKYVKNIKDSEWELNQELFSFLDIYARNYAFQLIPEYRHKNKSKPDFGIKELKSDETGIYIYDQKSEHFFDIECKRLYDTTKSKQYVSGKTGGIQRFKENKHGVGLLYSAMIGYIEIEDFNFWHNKVNSWISEKTEYLKPVEIKKIAKYKSTHKRNIEKTSIELIHFWLNFNKIE
ncbi:MAG: hypothetical protein A2X08_16390 [Bacteroidetes bacterium GWA2_32_17]|nr:MAG: hypothetical protein A2X08_16390 [Bacteroidetes bacterium GWA2_32_17]